MILERFQIDMFILLVSFILAARAALKMICSGWDPLDAESYIFLSWDREGAIVIPGDVVDAFFNIIRLELDIWNNLLSLDIVIEGIG